MSYFFCQLREHCVLSHSIMIICSCLVLWICVRSSWNLANHPEPSAISDMIPRFYEWQNVQLSRPTTYTISKFFEKLSIYINVSVRCMVGLRWGGGGNACMWLYVRCMWLGSASKRVCHTLQKGLSRSTLKCQTPQPQTAINVEKNVQKPLSRVNEQL